MTSWGRTRPGSHASAVGSHNFAVEQLRDAGADYAIASQAEPLPL